MHPSNHYYGQAHVLAAYCGMTLDEPPTIMGVLQHGWNPLHGHGFQKKETPRGFANFVWSDAPRRRGQAHGWRDYYPIGSAWSYLVSMQPPAVDKAVRSGTIFYPFHGWEGGQVIGSHENLIAEIKDTETPPVTVCLYWIDYENLPLRRLYEGSGFRVICHGHRGTKRRNTETRFMYRQYDEMVRHRRVASNRLSTAVFYGASVGCDIAVYGDPMRYDAEISHVERRDHVQRLFPELHGKQIRPDVAAEVARRELGADRLAPPSELRQLFGWRTC